MEAATDNSKPNAPRRRRRGMSTVQLSFLMTSGGSCITLFAVELHELLKGGDSLAWLLIVTTFVYFLWFVLRYISITTEGAETTTFDWLVSVFVWIAGMICIQFVQDAVMWLRSMGLLSMMAVVKDLQALTQRRTPRRQKHHGRQVRHELFFGLSLWLLSLAAQSNKIIALASGVYALAYVGVELSVRLRRK